MSESTWAPTPPTKLVSDLQRAIAGYVLMPTDPEVLETALFGIHLAIDRLNTRPWNWLLDHDDIYFVADQTDYVLSRWFKSPRNFEIWNTDSQAVFRLEYKDWKTFLIEHQNFAAESTPCVYSCANVNATGLLSLNALPSADWITTYPAGRIWYYRKIQYPVGTSSVDIPSEATPYIYDFACGHTADAYAVTKAATAYSRAKEMFDPGPSALVRDDAHGRQTDWE